MPVRPLNLYGASKAWGEAVACFYADQCWTKGAAAISWHVDDPINWIIAYRPATS